MKAINVLSKAAYAAPLVPSILIGWAVYEAANEITVTLFRVLAAVAFAVAFEGAGVMAGALQNRRFLALYVGLGVVTLVALELFTVPQLVVGVAALLVAALVYSVMGEREKETVDKVDSRQERREAAERRHQIKLEKIKADRDVRIAADTRPAMSTPVRSQVDSSPATWDSLTAADLQYLHSEDIPQAEKAARFNVSDRTVRRWLSKNGVAK